MLTKHLFLTFERFQDPTVMSQAKQNPINPVVAQQQVFQGIQNISQSAPQFPYNNVTTSYPVQFAHQMNNQQQQLAAFWNQVQKEINQADSQTINKHNVQLPMARIKKIMKTDESVRTCMIGSEAPILLAKACEIFMRELTIRAWSHTEEGKRRTLQKTDISSAVSKSDIFDFLIDIVPREESKTTRKEEISKVMPYEAVYYYCQPPANQTLPMQTAPLIDSRMPQNQQLPLNPNNNINANMPLTQNHIPASLPNQDMLFPSSFNQRMISQTNPVQSIPFQQQLPPQPRVQQANYNMMIR